MKLINIIKPRQSGKSTELVKRSAEQKIPIITRNKNECKYLKSIAEKLNLEIPDPICIKTAMNTLLLQSDKVIIDDAEYILNYMMKNLCRAEIDTIAMTEYGDDGYEIIPDGKSLKDVERGVNNYD